jgi:hypothetical protein
MLTQSKQGTQPSAANIAPMKAATKKTAKPKGRTRDKKGGRPTKYSEELADKILVAIAKSANGLATVCRKNPGFPTPETVRSWLAKDEEFLRRYTRAREEQAEFIADEIMEITDELSRKRELTHEQIAAARLRMDARKWVASKLKPKKYGDKVDMTTDGESLNNGFLQLMQQTSKYADGENRKL